MVKIFFIMAGLMSLIFGYQNCTQQAMSFKNGNLQKIVDSSENPGEFTDAYDDVLAFDDNGEVIAGGDMVETIDVMSEETTENDILINEQSSTQLEFSENKKNPLDLNDTDRQISAVDPQSPTTTVDGPTSGNPTSENPETDPLGDAQDPQGDTSNNGDTIFDSNEMVICILEGPGKSVRLGYLNDTAAANGKMPDTICMSKNACLDIVSQKFNVKMAHRRGFCPKNNPKVKAMSDGQVQALVDQL